MFDRIINTKEELESKYTDMQNKVTELAQALENERKEKEALQLRVNELEEKQERLSKRKASNTLSSKESKSIWENESIRDEIRALSPSENKIMKPTCQYINQIPINTNPGKYI